MKTAHIEVDLPMLINHCGKLRMLSHRFVMMLSLCQQDVPRKAEYFAAAQEALKGLKTTAPRSQKFEAFKRILIFENEKN